MMSEAEVYFASPTSFNDPLDCSPTIEVDIEIDVLEKLLYRMVASLRTPQAAKGEISNHRYMATEYGDYKVPGPAMEYYKRRLSSAIQESLQKEFGKHGVLSLASRWNCPLMWSHYADHHQGICLEYEMDERADVNPVEYALSRRIRASDIAAWKLDHSMPSKELVYRTFFFAKAPSWKYEREWRSVSDSIGPQFIPARLNAVHFGLRCDTSIITTLVMLHAAPPASVKFYGIRARDQGFRLTRKRINTELILANGVRTSPWLEFRDIFTDETDG